MNFVPYQGVAFFSWVRAGKVNKRITKNAKEKLTLVRCKTHVMFVFNTFKNNDSNYQKYESYPYNVTEDSR